MLEEGIVLINYLSVIGERINELHLIVFDTKFYLVMVYLLKWGYGKASFELSVTRNIKRR